MEGREGRQERELRGGDNDGNEREPEKFSLDSGKEGILIVGEAVADADGDEDDEDEDEDEE
eukprot:CAMPEP_0184666028 /NCGR_PEP_ID=MMETSP0308-20130426/59780_1 /TAXON_ID=38269 /ORGANISM="Gloeochaete witrockiana, Strain SAG 46.84" /LENGTH=60 /DNA_ID=CAMNT_0027110393 /DNA_START=67 /DNA_END=246 /DNA_ORIENTATION=+